MNSKSITLAGAVVLIIGLFLPAVNVMGMGMSVLLPAGQLNAPGLILVACAVLAGILALMGQGKWAVIPGIAAVGYLVWQFLEAQKSLSGAGDIRLNKLAVDDLGIKVTGSGDIRFNGRAGKLGIAIAGSGDVDTAGLEADDVSVSIAGSGDASVNARKTLAVSIAGSGDVVYSGDAVPKTSIAGSGTVRKK